VLPLLREIRANVEHRRDQARGVNLEQLLEGKNLHEVLQRYVVVIQFLVKAAKIVQSHTGEPMEALFSKDLIRRLFEEDALCLLEELEGHETGWFHDLHLGLTLLEEFSLSPLLFDP
jgi:hypothetical protein